MSKPTYLQDYNAIIKVLNKYCAGCAQADSNIMQTAFNEQTRVCGLNTEGKLNSRPIQHLFEEIDGSDFPASSQAQTAIVNVDIVGTAASARIDMNDIGPGFCFTDFFHLLKVEGKWTVIGKIFHAHVAT